MAARKNNGNTYSEELFARILERIAAGESVAQICVDEDMPSQRAFYNWLNKDEELVQKYARARETQADAIFDEILQIADEARNDWMERHGEDDAGWQANGEHIQRSKLRIDARKWVASKLAPKKYGDRMAVDHTVSVGLADRFARAEKRTDKDDA